MSSAVDQSTEAVIDEMERLGLDVREDSQHQLVRVLEKTEYQLLRVREDGEHVAEIRSAAPFKNVIVCTCGRTFHDVDAGRNHVDMFNEGRVMGDDERDGWWNCPVCGAETGIEENTRSCSECEWSSTIPLQPAGDTS